MFRFILLFIILFLAGCSAGFQNNDSDKNQKIQTLDNQENTIIDTEGSPQLSFDDFKQRWNSLVAEQMSGLEIAGLEGITEDEGLYYRAMLTKEIELRIFEDQHNVQKLEVHTQGKTPTVRRQMLTSWSHVVNMMQQEMKFEDVDALFHEAGVGPNFDISNVKEKK
ncbi:hypothetical protein [Bacillus timonensis]|uniref:hypothetical protein n=1 Tax=Bacillus timonensis TaxID=1033734 RepID=UPI000287BC0F|nr:hypothetical protein [Bacillus timonensis]